MCLETYKLDPLHYFTAPGLFNDALYKLTGEKIELFSEIDMYNFCEKGIRGGLSVQTHRYAKANHEYIGLDSFDPTKLKEFILYLDANNLYGWAMKQSLPVAMFAWMRERNTAEWKRIVEGYDEDAAGEFQKAMRREHFANAVVDFGERQGQTFEQVATDTHRRGKPLTYAEWVVSEPLHSRAAQKFEQHNFAKLLSPVDILSAIIAALTHDMGHPGLNNTFLETTRHELAVTRST